jgi:CO dehydrogenase maturation factor
MTKSSPPPARRWGVENVCATRTHESTSDANPDRGVRVVVVGKGGVGKSTLTAMLARSMARLGAQVIAIDSDEQRNLGATLGIDVATMAGVVPLASSADYIEEKTGARPGEGSGSMLRLNPDTSDVVERLAIGAPDGVRLLVMGGVRRAGGGCLCPENALLAAVIANMRLRRGEVVIMDTHAGVEHFGRALAQGFDRALVVVEPTFNSIQVALETARLAKELGIETIDLVINQCRRDGDVANALSYVERLGGYEFSSITELPFDEGVLVNEPSVGDLPDDSPLAAAVWRLSNVLLNDGRSATDAGDRMVVNR